jgi:hypothetical protein
VEQCAEHVVHCLRDLGKSDIAFSRWFQAGRSRKKALEREVQITHETVKELLFRGRSKRDIGGDVMEELGFSMRLWNGGEDCQSVGFSVTCGGYARNPNVWNSCVINLPSEGHPSERLLKVEVLLRLMRAVIESFDPHWATVMPDSLLRTVQFVPNIPVPGWLFYFANSVSRQPHLPAATRVVNVAGRGKILIVAEERFNTQRTEHLQAHAAVQAAIAPALQF